MFWGRFRLFCGLGAADRAIYHYGKRRVASGGRTSTSAGSAILIRPPSSTRQVTPHRTDAKNAPRRPRQRNIAPSAISCIGARALGRRNADEPSGRHAGSYLLGFLGFEADRFVHGCVARHPHLP
jgi:hypothetical protein